jgi:threonine aldolase
MPLDNLAAVVDVARSHGLPVHMDGARVFNAAIALDIPVQEVARHVDSVMFCISKGLAAPVGSVLVGSTPFIASARRTRKVVGGGMRQAGILAAAGLYALEHMVDRLVEDHANAQVLADALREQGWSIDRRHVETNIFFVEPPTDVAMAGLDDRLAQVGVLVSTPHTGRTIRLATHYGIEADDISRAISAFAKVSRRD